MPLTLPKAAVEQDVVPRGLGLLHQTGDGPEQHLAANKVGDKGQEQYQHESDELVEPVGCGWAHSPAYQEFVNTFQ